MNMLKKLATTAVFLCAATVANAEDGMKIGARLGYSMQNVAYGTGMLGLGAGLGVDIPIGPAFFSPEAAFLYRNNWRANDLLATGKVVDHTQPEFAVSIPIMVKFILGMNSFISLGAQVDIPIDAKECFGDECVKMDGKELPYFTKRADYDVGVILSFGYIITPSLALDFRYIYGITPHSTYKMLNEIIPGEVKQNPVSSYGFGVKYYF